MVYNAFADTYVLLTQRKIQASQVRKLGASSLICIASGHLDLMIGCGHLYTHTYMHMIGWL